MTKSKELLKLCEGLKDWELETIKKLQKEKIPVVIQKVGIWKTPVVKKDFYTVKRYFEKKGWIKVGGEEDCPQFNKDGVTVEVDIIDFNLTGVYPIKKV